MAGKKQKKKKESKRKASSQDLKGSLELTRSGRGFVIVDGRDKDIVVHPGDLNTALDGDTVTVRIKDEKKGRTHGVITSVLQRKQTSFIGQLQMNKGFAFFVAATDRAMPDIYIPEKSFNGAKDGDRVVVKLLEWDDKDKRPLGEVSDILDPEDANESAMHELILQNGFTLEFPDDVIEETARIPEIITDEEVSRRKDIRDLFTITIDPVDAKDFDDAISYRVLDNGKLEIGVHIADVSHYIEPDSALDKEAYTRATSVYLPDRVVPMLPEQLSNVLCSLRPHEDKLCFSAIFQVDEHAKVQHYWVGRTVIHSNHRFTYEEVQEIIETGDGLYKDELLKLNEIARKLRGDRFNKGAINFSSQEVRFKLDENGKPVGVMIKESKEAHQLIEEYMLLANRKVAEKLAAVKVNNKPLPVPYRIHDTPDEEKLVPFMAFARKFGHTFDMSSPEKVAESFNNMLKQVQGKPEQHVLEQLGIRTMAKAIYTTENIGHYGLGFEHYCHFTSPIRRYPDVLIHRALQEVLDNEVKVDKKMEAKCKHCSERERAAMETERAANKYKQVEYMMNFIGEEFEGVISGVASFGFWVETVEHKCEGLVSITSLAEYDDFRHVEEDYSLQGMRTHRKFRMGDTVRIKVIAANLEKRQLDYEWVITAAIAEERKSSQQKTKKNSNS